MEKHANKVASRYMKSHRALAHEILDNFDIWLANLGSVEWDTVFEAEVLSLFLAAKLIMAERNMWSVSIKAIVKQPCSQQGTVGAHQVST